MDKFKNIERFYFDNHDLLLENDEYRPCKSFPRDVSSYVEKFKTYYVAHKPAEGLCVVTEDIITYDILKLSKWSDVVTTAKRIMREFFFLTRQDDNTYVFTMEFDSFVNTKKTLNEYIFERIKTVSSMDSMNMIFNGIICMLREGYLYGDILSFPDSVERFKQSITNKNDRDNFRKRVFDLYGFAGRYHDYTRDDYTPNANYRISTLLNSLGFIESVESDFDGIGAHRLTQKAYDFLEILDSNLGEITDEEFEELIGKENEFEEKIKRLAEEYGVEGTIEVTSKVRLPQVQDAFRDRLIEKHGRKCLLCNISNKEMLIASHIRRAADEDIYGKADYNNGLLLCANHDKLFDRYLISFSCLDGRIMISKSLTDEEKRICELDENYCLPPDILTEERAGYLIDHNKIFLQKENER